MQGVGFLPEDDGQGNTEYNGCDRGRNPGSFGEVAHPQAEGASYLWGVADLAFHESHRILGEHGQPSVEKRKLARQVEHVYGGLAIEVTAESPGEPAVTTVYVQGD